jgi:hypothetical protein
MLQVVCRRFRRVSVGVPLDGVETRVVHSDTLPIPGLRAELDMDGLREMIGGRSSGERKSP